MFLFITLKALLRKAEAHYIHGDLEHALMYYHKGRRLRPNMNVFTTGVKNCETAIMDCVGGTKTLQLFYLSRSKDKLSFRP